MIMADAIVTVLRDMDLRYLFGVSGANIEHIHDAVYRLGEGRFTSIMAKTEFGAAFMADVRARTHRTLGVCCATSGGGMMNLAVGIAESYAQEVPVLALVGQTPLSQEGCGAFQDSSGKAQTVDGRALWQSISKCVVKMDTPALFWTQFAEALTAPFTGRPGPAVMLLPRDMMQCEVGEPPSWFASRIKPAAAQALCSTLLSDVLTAIKAAKNPVLILGSGVARQDAQTLAQEVATLGHMAVASTLACPGVFDNGHAQYIGMIGAAGHPSTHDYIINKADLVIAVGTKLRVMNRGPLAQALARVKLIMVNAEHSEVDPMLDVSLVIDADAHTFLSELASLLAIEPMAPRLTDHPMVTCFAPQPIAYARGGRRLAHGTDRHLTQSNALKVIGDYLPQAGHVLFDAGNCAAAAAHYLQMPSGTSTTIALGMGGMGYAVAGAIGAQLGAEPSAKTVVICGDGAFMMTGMEIHTAVDLGLPILWLVFNNNMHGMCVTRQHLIFDGRIEGNTYANVDIAKIASGLGAPSHLWVGAADSPERLSALLDEYVTLHSHKPGVLEIRITQEEMPPFSPFLQPGTPTQPAW